MISRRNDRNQGGCFVDKKKFCTNCGSPYLLGESSCQQCGIAFSNQVVATKSKALSGITKIFIGLLILVILGGIVKYSIPVRFLSPDKVIKNTLSSLESGKIIVDVLSDRSISVYVRKTIWDFIKNKEEKTFLIRGAQGPVYFSLKNNQVEFDSFWDEKCFDLEKEIGIDPEKLEKELIDYIGNVFKGKKMPEAYVQNIAKKKVGGKYVITFDVLDEIKLLDWLGICLQSSRLGDLIAENIENRSFRRNFKNEYWGEIVEEIKEYIYMYLPEDCEMDTCGEIIVDKRGILDELNFTFKIAGDNEGTLAIGIKIIDKNAVASIRNPLQKVREIYGY